MRPPSIFSFPSIVPVAGILKLESGRTLLPVVRPSTVRLPTLFDPPHSLGEDRPGGSGRGSGGPLLASETMFLKLLSLLGGTSQSSSSVEGPCLPTHVSSSASETRKPPSHTLAAFREKGKQAGLSDRAADFTAEALRESTRASYDSKLELFFKWCNDFTCDPYSASLGQVADFLIFFSIRVLLSLPFGAIVLRLPLVIGAFRMDPLFQSLLSFPICVSPSF